MTTAMAWRGSLSIGLLVAGSLSVACGSSAADSGDGSTASGGSAGGAIVSGQAGTSNPVSTGGTGTSPIGVAGSSSSAAGAGGSGGGFAGGPGMGGGSGMTSSGASGGMTSSGGASGGSAGTGTVTPTGKTEYAPYYEIGADTGAFNSLTDLKTKSGVNDVTLAFVLSGGGCNTDNTLPDDMDDIKAFIAAGGHVKASFGGADGTYVESKCSDATSYGTALENFVDATGITDLDFDVEQGAQENTAKDALRGQGMKMVQDSKHAQISFTLQTDENGMDGGAQGVVKGAVAAGVTIYHVNMMVMDYGNMTPGKAIAPIAIGTLNGANKQLMTMIPGLTAEQAWAMLGATPDIGQNDDNEIFSLQDATDLTNFAKTNKLGLLAFWSIQRDQTCGKGECSQHDNNNFDYSNIFKTAAQ
jgi:hypothetical protein